MQPIVLNAIVGFLCATCLVTALPAGATDQAQDETIVDPEWAGDIVWKQQFGTTSYDSPIGLAADAVGNILIGGWLGDGRTLVAKYSPGGKRVWERKIESWYNNRIAWDSTGHFFIAGNYAGNYDNALIAKYGRAGEKLWSIVLTYPQVYPSALATDATGNVLVAGSTSEGYSCCPSDAFIAKYSATGQLLWTRTFGSWANDSASAVTTDAAGNIVIAGSTEPEWESSDAFVAKYDSGGKLLWSRNIGTVDGRGDRASAVAADGGGNIVISGQLGDYSSDSLDAFVARYSPSGKLLWSRKLKTGAGEAAWAIATDVARNVVISGWTGGSLGAPNQGGFSDVFVAKYSPAGERRWIQQFGTPKEDLAYGVVTDPAGNVVTTGQTRGSLGGASRGDMDLFILKLRP